MLTVLATVMSAVHIYDRICVTPHMSAVEQLQKFERASFSEKLVAARSDLAQTESMLLHLARSSTISAPSSSTVLGPPIIKRQLHQDEPLQHALPAPELAASTSGRTATRRRSPPHTPARRRGGTWTEECSPRLAPDAALAASQLATGYKLEELMQSLD